MKKGRSFALIVTCAAVAASTAAVWAQNPGSDQDDVQSYSQTTTTTGGLAANPDLNASSVTLTGKPASMNFVAPGFWLNTGTRSYPVVLNGANISFNGQQANMYRLMGSPRVQVQGSLVRGTVDATSVEILSGPTTRLQQSSYTDQAQPPFGADQLAPLHYGSGDTMANNSQSYVTHRNYGRVSRPRTTRRHHSMRRHTRAGW